MDNKPLRGFRDFYPDDFAPREELISKIINIGKKFGFRMIECPSVESLELFEKKSGPDIVNETFAFTDKGNRKITLIPELTPSEARIYIAKQKELVKPVKWMSFSKMWRYEEPQSGRLREFYQWNFDIFGVATMNAEGELIALACSFLDELNLQGKYIIKLSNRKLLENLIRSWNMITKFEDILRIIDKKTKLSDKEFEIQLSAIGLDKNNIDTLKYILNYCKKMSDSLSELKNLFCDEKSKEPISELEELQNLLTDYEIADRCELDLSIVRGLAYYTSTVFECHDADGQLRAIFGGGRYDNLIELLGGEPTPAVGFAVGDVTLELLMRKSNVWVDKKYTTDIFVVRIGDVPLKKVIAYCSNLRKKGLSVEYDLLNRKLVKQLNYANKLNVRYILFIGEDELKNGKVKIKNYQTGEEILVDDNVESVVSVVNRTS